ncbi:taspase, threonine aspartase, 1 [Linnemannia gamsii]|uniref:Taspase, threonine aspartase, 1 n=1 Tax=Linnemannia gamsii TaxID=64522 RepID=A0ABQ7KC38_9FUNG|nr:taspase, threonine aspartase, 1 [Linnemannia gamsii]
MIRILEDDPVTNAGTGSNLNLDGLVECDASLMDGTTLGFGSVGAISDFKNPISVAAKILQESDQGALSLGRIPPIMLVGPGAAQWVETMDFPSSLSHSGLQRVPRQPSADALAIARELMSEETGAARKRDNEESEGTVDKESIALEIDEDQLQDTVGAICIDSQGRVAAGVSSGGIAMKFPGRVSEAALFGAGCWAQDATEDTDGFTCSLTGAGEQITKTLLARTCMETYLSHDDISEVSHQVLDRFMKSPLLKGYPDKHAGWIGAKVDREDGCGRAEFVFAHTTQTMGVGFMSVQDTKPTTIMSKKTPEATKVVSTRMVRL